MARTVGTCQKCRGSPSLSAIRVYSAKLALEGLDLADLQLARHPVGEAADLAEPVAGPARDLDHLVGDRQPLSHGSWLPNVQELPHHQRNGEHVVVVEIAGDRHRLVAELLRVARRVLPVVLLRQTDEQPRAQAGIAVADRRQGLFDQLGDHGVLRARLRDHAVRDRRLCQPLRVADLAGESGGRFDHLARVDEAPGAGHLLRELEGQLELGRGVARRQDRQRALEMVGRVGVREPRCGLARSGQRERERRLLVAGPGFDEVARQRRQEALGVVAALLLERPAGA